MHSLFAEVSGIYVPNAVDAGQAVSRESVTASVEDAAAPLGPYPWGVKNLY